MKQWTLAACHTPLEFLSWDVVMKYLYVCPCLSKCGTVKNFQKPAVRGLGLINQSLCSLQFRFHPVFQPPLLNIMHFVINQTVGTCTSWNWPYPDPGVMLSLKTEDTSCVKTSRVLTCTSEICRDKQREEAIELRQAPKSVKPCYPKGGKKNRCSPFWVGMLLYTVLTHCRSQHHQGRAAWHLTSPVNRDDFPLIVHQKCWKWLWKQEFALFLKKE